MFQKGTKLTKKSKQKNEKEKENTATRKKKKMVSKDVSSLKKTEKEEIIVK